MYGSGLNMSIVINSNGSLAGNGGKVYRRFSDDYFEQLCNNISLSCKIHFPCVAKTIPFASCRTYIFHRIVPPMWNNASDKTNMAEKKYK